MNLPTPEGLARIGQISLPVSDLDRAVAFYRDQLGMRFLFQVPSLAFFDCGGVRLMLGLPESPSDERRASVLYFTVADIAASHTALIERGVPFVDRPHVVAQLGEADLWMAFFTDPDGNLLAIMAEVLRG